MFLVEDGNGVTDSNSYVNINDSDSYHTLRGNVDWVNASSESKEIALIKASQFFDVKLSKLMNEDRLVNTQGLFLPTTKVPINTKLKNTINEYAIIALTLPLIKKTKANNSDKIKSRKVKVGDIATETVLSTSDGTKELNIEEFPLADELFQVFVNFIKTIDPSLIRSNSIRSSRA